MNQKHDYKALHADITRVGGFTLRVRQVAVNELIIAFPIHGTTIMVCTTIMGKHNKQHQVLEFNKDGSAWIIKPDLLEDAVRALKQFIINQEEGE